MQAWALQGAAQHAPGARALLRSAVPLAGRRALVARPWRLHPEHGVIALIYAAALASGALALI